MMHPTVPPSQPERRATIRISPGGESQRECGPASPLRGLDRRRYLDDVVDRYVGWREACSLVDAAYSNWKHAGRHDQKLAFSEYVAALDDEEEAASVYQHAVERVAATHGACRADWTLPWGRVAGASLTRASGSK